MFVFIRFDYKYPVMFTHFQIIINSVLQSSRPKPEGNHHEPAVSIDASFNPLKFLKAPAHTNAVQPNVLVNSSMNTAIPTKSKNPGLILSPELEQKLEEIYNRTKTIPGKPPRWPITNSRDAHRDEDVFIARANNPFGHSTKWRWR